MMVARRRLRERQIGRERSAVILERIDQLVSDRVERLQQPAPLLRDAKGADTHTHSHSHTYTHTHTHTRTHTRTHARTHAHTHARTHTAVHRAHTSRLHAQAHTKA
eukprot:6210169-Pleurochrysis_carterae.AAC.1